MTSKKIRLIVHQKNISSCYFFTKTTAIFVKNPGELVKK